MKKRYYISIINILLLISTTITAQLPFYERAYLQTDKQSYLAGEMIWFKLHITNEGGIPLGISKIGYIELLNDQTPVVQVKTELHQGIGNGWIQLPATLPTGNYKLVAYTRYMQNEGESIFFNKTISIINTFEETVYLAPETIFSQNQISQNFTNTVSVLSDKITYSIRTDGIISISNLPDNIHTLSISITGKDIESSPLNRSIQQWYGTLQTDRNSNFNIELLPEYEGHIIKGRLIDQQTNQPVYNKEVVPVIGFVGDKINVTTGQIALNSDVTFYTKDINGYEELVSTVFNDPLEKYRIDILPPFIEHTPQSIEPLFVYENQKEELLKRSIGLQATYIYKKDSIDRLKEGRAFLEIKPDWRYNLDEYTRFPTIEETLIEYVKGLRFRRSGKQKRLYTFQEETLEYTTGNTLVLLDGIPLNDHDVIYNYNPLHIKELEVYRGKYSFGDSYFDGIAFFKTKERNYQGLQANTLTQFYAYSGTQAERIFYAPVYNTPEEKNNRLPDFRHTLLWNPDIKYISGEKSIDISFTTSDLTGDFKVIVEGITLTGQPIYGTTSIIVE